MLFNSHVVLPSSWGREKALKVRDRLDSLKATHPGGRVRLWMDAPLWCLYIDDNNALVPLPDRASACWH